MEPDDFRACLISMGYDLVSTPPPPSPESHQCPLLCMDHLLYASHLHIHDLISSSLHLLGLGRIIPFHMGYYRFREVTCSKTHSWNLDLVLCDSKA